jgi:hypothetical protein
LVSLLLAWVVFPAVALGAAVGCGLLVERASGGRVPGVLLAPLGFAAIIVVSQVTTYWDATAELTTPAVVVAALAGFALGFRRVREARLDGWAVLAAAGVFAVFGAPVILSGEATFSGYQVTGDTGFQFVGVDYLLEQGRAMRVLPPSTYEFYAQVYFGGAYPSGAQTALGAVRPLAGQDVAWVYQPFISLLAATIALSLYSLVRPLVSSAPLRAGVAFLAAQPALVLGYALQGQIKEVATAALIVLVAALVPPFVSERYGSARRVAPLAVATAGTFGALGPSVGVWLAPILLAALAAGLLGRDRPPRRRVLAHAGAFVAATALIAFPAVATIPSYFNDDTDFLSDPSELGNLSRPLSPFQVVGIWLSGDYRGLDERWETLTFVLVGVALAALVVGLVWLVRRRAWPVLVLIAGAVVACAVIMRSASPYADGKTMMVTSPIVLLVAVLAVPALLARRRVRVIGAALGGLLALGVLGSAAMAYHDASLAPRERFVELGRIGERFAGRGPALFNEFDEMDKHFLRQTDPEGGSEAYRRRGTGLRGGKPPDWGRYYDLDQFRPSYLASFPLLVQRRSPAASRPPAPYRRVFAGRYYDVWQRPSGADTVVEHLPLGSRLQAGEEAPCGRVQRLATRAAGDGAYLAYAPRERSPGLAPGRADHAANWAPSPSDPATLMTAGPGYARGHIRVERPARYRLWLLGSLGRRVDVWIGDRRVAAVEYHLNGPEQFLPLGEVWLDRGRHPVRFTRGGGGLEPGNGNVRSLGPLLLTDGYAESRPVRRLDAGAWRRLCGRRLDWIESVRG